jgi:hypothetical protein
MILLFQSGVSAQGTTVIISFEAEQFLFDQVRGYDRVRLIDGSVIGQLGEPVLPTLQIKVAIPSGTEATDIHVRSVDSEEIAGSYHLFPGQPPARLDGSPAPPFVEPDERVYSSTADYPGKLGELVGQTDLAGQQMAVVTVYPMQYVPATGQLILHQELEITVESRPGYESRESYAKFTDKQRAHYEEMVKGMVINPQDVVIDPPIRGASKALPAGDFDHVIITSSSYVSYFDDLVEWHNKRGLRDTVVTTSYIYANYSGSDNQKEIRNFIIDAHSTWGTMYFLMGGEDGTVPFKYRYYYDESTPSDQYYADYDDDWTCEVYVGRISGSSSTQFSTAIDKIINYEKNPPTSNYPKDVLLIGMDLTIPPEYPRTPAEDLKETIDGYIPSGFNVTKVYDSHGGNHETATINALNAGQNLVNHADHSNSNVLGLGYLNHGSWALYNSDVDALTNSNQPSNLVSLGCWANDMTYSDGIAEHFVIYNANQAGVSFTGNTRSGWGYVGYPESLSGQLDRDWWRGLFNYSQDILGHTLVWSKHQFSTGGSDADLKKHCEWTFSLLGDPAMPLWTDDPENLDVTHPDTISGAGSSFLVHVESGGSDLSGAYVCLWKQGEVYLTDNTNSNGDVTFNPSPSSPGTLYVTVTKHNYLPYAGDAQVIGSVPQVTVTYPNGGEVLTDYVTITWTATDPDPGETALLLIDLDYSANAGGTWAAIDSNQTNDGSYLWDISGLPDGDNYLVRIIATDTTGFSGSDTSDAVFSVNNDLEPPQVTVTYPNGGEILTDSVTVTWMATDPDPGETDLLLVDLDYSANAGTTWAVIDSGQTNDGAYLWDISGLPDGDTYLIRIAVTDTSGLFDSDGSDAVFFINNNLEPPQVAVIYPNGGEVLADSVAVSWTATDPDPGETALLMVDLDYSANAGTTWAGIDSGQTNDGSYRWDTFGVPDGDTYLIRITVTDTSSLFDSDSCDAVFSIYNPDSPQVTVTYPNGGEVLTDSVTVTWTATDPDPGETDLLLVDLDYSANAGSTWAVIDSGQTNDGSYLWDISGLPEGDNYLVRIAVTDTSGLFDSDSSDSVFSVNNDLEPPQVTVTYPNGGEVLTDSVTVIWTATDPDPGETALLMVDLDYSANAGTTWAVIDSGQTNDGSYLWDISGLPEGDNYLVRIAVTDTSSLFDSDSCDAVFSIYNPDSPQVTVTYPNGGEVLADSVTITWMATDPDPGETDLLLVDLAYSANAGTTWAGIDSGQTNDGSYRWDTFGVPDGDTYLIFITVTDTSWLFDSDTSDAVFSINNNLEPPQVTVSYPNGGEVLADSVAISWTATDPDPGETALLMVDLDYSANAGTTWAVIDSNQTNDGSCLWDISGLPEGDNYLVRIAVTDTSGLYDCDSSDAVFTINNLGPPQTWSTFLGGDDEDAAHGLAVDGSGNAYVTGRTWSANFPTTAGAFDETHNGGNSDIFVAKLNLTGSGLIYATFLGGDYTDADTSGTCIFVDSSNNAYVTGKTWSANFPTTAGAFDETHNGYADVFVTKLNAAGSALVYSTFLGGDDTDAARGIAVDGSSNAYIAGMTRSGNFPTTAGAFDETHNGWWDAFVAKLNSTGSGLAYSTFLGGNADDAARGIAVDDFGNAYVTGYTDTLDGCFPTTAGAFDETFNGYFDAFVAKLNAAGSALAYSTFLGGDGGDAGTGIALDSSSNAYVTGGTGSANFPTTAGAFDETHNGWGDVFMAKLNSTGSGLVYSTFLGGSDGETGSGIAVDGSGNAYVSGRTWSANFPTTAGAFDETHNGWLDVFVAKLIIGGGDSTPPEVIDDLKIELTGSDIYLWWTEPYDDFGVTRYVIYRSTIAGSLGDSLAGTSDTTYTDVGAAGDEGTQYFYAVKAADAAGNKSGVSAQVGEFDIELINGGAVK